MQKNKKKRSRKGGVRHGESRMARSDESEPGHRACRKLRRLEARRAKKWVKKGVFTKNEEIELPSHVEEVAGRTHESYERRQEKRKKLALSNCERLVEKSSETLCHWHPESVEDPRPRNKKKIQLKGAARPATEVYPWLYPEKDEPVDDSRNLLVEFKGDLTSHKETLKHVYLWFELALLRAELGYYEKALEAFQTVSRMDSKGFFTLLATEKEVAIYIDQGELGHARKLIETSTHESHFLLWDLVLIEFIALRVLKEEADDSALNVALSTAYRESNCIGQALANDEEFELHLSPDDIELDESRRRKDLSTRLHEIGAAREIPSQFSLDERYFHRSISWWRDADGALDNIKSYIEMQNKIEDRVRTLGETCSARFVMKIK